MQEQLIFLLHDIIHQCKFSRLLCFEIMKKMRQHICLVRVRAIFPTLILPSVEFLWVARAMQGVNIKHIYLNGVLRWKQPVADLFVVFQ